LTQANPRKIAEQLARAVEDLLRQTFEGRIADQTITPQQREEDKRTFQPAFDATMNIIDKAMMPASTSGN